MNNIFTKFSGTKSKGRGEVRMYTGRSLPGQVKRGLCRKVSTPIKRSAMGWEGSTRTLWCLERALLSISWGNWTRCCCSHTMFHRDISGTLLGKGQELGVCSSLLSLPSAKHSALFQCEIYLKKWFQCFFRKTFLQKFSKQLESSKNRVMNPHTFPMIILSFLFHFSFTLFFFFNLEYFKTNPRYLVISPVNNRVCFSTWERHLLFSKYNYHAFITCNKI